MEIQPITQQPISDDQELAKVLAGVSQQADDAAAVPEPVAPPLPPAPAPIMEEPIAPPATVAPVMPVTEPAQIPSNLDSIKNDALLELRPLVDKLNVSPEEKFDTYLLLLRSTDDSTLIGPAHEAARSIADETRRAQALLDVIKEIDYLSNPPQNVV